MDDPMKDLRKVAAQLKRIDAQRASKMAERDRLIASARAAGHTWKDIQATSGLSPRAISKALSR